MSNELSLGIDKPSIYRAYKNFVDTKWNVYETIPAVTSNYSRSVIMDAYGSDAYGDYFEIDSLLLNAGWNRVIYNFDYESIIDGYGKAYGLTAEEVISLFFDGYSFDGYSFAIEQQIRYDIANRIIVSMDGNYYKEIRRSVDGYGTIESRLNPSDLFQVDSNQQSVGFREEQILKNLSEGYHVLKIDAIADLDDGSFIDGYGIRNFLVSNTAPVIDIITPIAFDPADLATVGQEQPTLIYTINGTENPVELSLINVEFSLDDGYGNFTPPTNEELDGYSDGFGFIDGYGDRGRIPSGTRLNLRPGSYVMRIIAQDTAGNIGSAYRRFSFNLPFAFGNAPIDMWVGSDIKGTNQSDSIIEELMIRNVEISDDDASLDYLAGLRDLHFRTIESNRLIFTTEEEAKIRKLAIDILTASGELPSTLTSVEREKRITQEISVIESHLNDTSRTLLLSHFNVDIEPTDGAGTLVKEFNPVVKERESLGELQITILQKPSEVIDKDLLNDLIEKIKPAHVRVILKFQEVSE